jgi:polysaccharide pyruvyl transferase WcaK-like protein
MQKISVFDTTISDFNLGNEIIMDSINKHLHELFPHDFFFKLPVMEITSYTKFYLNQSDLIFFGGTNSLSSRMEWYKQWGLNFRNYRSVRGTILMGIGWWQYQRGGVSWYTKFLLKNTLNKKHLHSARDTYTEKKLISLGFDNVLNTGCPTLWDLTPEHCAKIKREKAPKVVITLTDYAQKPKRDKIICDLALKNYEQIYLWPQGSGDYAYAQKILGEEASRIIFLDPNLKAFDQILNNPEIEYLGTRLHGGIRALQQGRRAIIVGIDNRAKEMKKDFNLPVIEAEELSLLDNLINSAFETKIKLPQDNIDKWKDQFSELKNV